MKNLKALLKIKTFFPLAAILILSLASCGNGSASSASEPVTVSISAIQGVTPPATGGAPVSSITPTDQYAGSVSWSPPVSSAFLAGTSYTATITLSAKPGYSFSGVPADFFTVQGAASSNPANSNKVTAVFPAIPHPQVTFNNIPDFKAWFDSQPENSPQAPYNVRLNVNSLNGNSWDSESAGNVLYTNNGLKYVNLDLSGCSFTVIDNGAFAACTNLTGVTIPSGVTSIADGAFTGTRLLSVTIPASVSFIGQEAFRNNWLTSVTFQGVISAGNFNDYAFWGDLRDKYLAGGPGTYIASRFNNDYIWAKQ